MAQERYPLQHLLQPYTVINRHIAFLRKWERLLGKIENLKVDSLEEYDDLLARMDQIYKSSSTRILQKYLNAEDEYQPKLKQLKEELCRRVDSRFNLMQAHALSLINESDEVSDVFREKKDFEEAIETFNLLDAFHKRWKEYTHDCKDRESEITRLREVLAKRHSLILNEWKKVVSIRDYQRKLGILGKIDEEMSRLNGWYRTEYLNLDGKNKNWYAKEDERVCVELPEDTDWVAVDLRRSDSSLVPLEHLKRLPSKKEIADMEDLFAKFLDFYVKEGIITPQEKHQLRYYDTFETVATAHSLDSEDSDERLKAALINQIGEFHTLINDAKSRHDFKKNHEKLLDLSFASYFAPLDEIYSILSTGHINSDLSLATKTSGLETGIPLRLSPNIEHGDAGFIFPVTKVLSKHLFVQLNSQEGPEVHIYNKANPQKPVKIDIRDGVFIAPSDKMLKYTIKDQDYHESYESYFRKFFNHLSKNPPEWFDPARAEGWLSRHCIFYTDEQRQQLLKLLENKVFVSVINRFTNRKLDNLAFYQAPGSLAPSGYHRIYRLPGPDSEKAKDRAVTLFEWVQESE
ncbi:TPA: hypothetical protein HA265_04355 [Candidatus Woesearchaeota archaeon]|nr:hypothetical protein [Candidatus Woesearchaeota archaeon]